MNAIRSWEADLARRLGIGGLIDFDRTTVGKTLHIPCAVGRHQVDFKVRQNLDPNGTVKELIAKGWTIGRRRIVCPDCKRKTEEEKAERRRARAQAATPKPSTANAADRFAIARAALTPEQIRENARKGGLAKHANRLKRNAETVADHIASLSDADLVRMHENMRAVRDSKPIPPQEISTMSSQPSIVGKPPVSSPTDTARQAKRATMDWLAESFNVEKGTFAAGVSDATIAKETGLSEKAVAAMREEFFGALGEPDELRTLRDELAAAKKSLDALKGAALQGAEQVIALDRRFTILCQRNGWPIV